MTIMNPGGKKKWVDKVEGAEVLFDVLLEKASPLLYFSPEQEKGSAPS